MKKKIVLFGLILIILLVGCLQFVFNKRYVNDDFHILDYYSTFDKDMDGIDDQTDVLLNTKNYLATKPKYKSKYYASGYPDDSYGVCTDVVAFALKNAGYDLRELVNEDIKTNPNNYDVENRDKNIDFRRVSNLNVYFKNHAISLTTNINDLSAWQGGDIVVFPKHIGIISNRRNRKGISYVFHHANPWQFSYEEDILEHQRIVGHYRIS